ncbi:MAG: hypothetical protein WHW07_03135 [Bacteroidales bacterium]|nr:hypothetical protein [Bacteroidales bacterium]HOL97424.1 hypothetical protein [Bacteroidales bacterium]HOM36056.1 hypothetical protein [Bacteroidales bacterium]HPD23366.1 hypothetical protein [Bacteroidales bacterium]HRS99698.1 hypothetical protein [Bacteroidales bacterium]
MRYFYVILISMFAVRALAQNYYVTDFSLKQAENLSIPVKFEEY